MYHQQLFSLIPPSFFLHYLPADSASLAVRGIDLISYKHQVDGKQIRGVHTPTHTHIHTHTQTHTLTQLIVNKQMNGMMDMTDWAHMHAHTETDQLK